ncbi:InlB B-repeat-containing protein [Pyxidicoccus sp. 3LG]
MTRVVLCLAAVVLAACGPVPEETQPPALETQRSSVNITVENQIVARLPGSSGANIGYAEYLPPGYLTSTRLYPAIIQLNGMGELGRATTETELYNVVTRNGALKNIRNSTTWKTYFGQKEAMVFAPQSYDNYSPAELRPFVQFIVANYRVDPTRIYLTGLSMGGWGTWRYAALYGNELAAVAPFATNIGAPGDTLTLLRDVPIWASSSHGEAGAQQSWLVSYTKVYGASQVVSVASTTSTVTYLFDKSTKAWTSQTGTVTTGASIARFIVLPGSSHIGWNESYNQQAFWDWMLAQQRGGTPPPEATKYTLTVNQGSGDGQYVSGTLVPLTADAPAVGYVFDRWTGATVTQATSATTTLSMPAAATTVTATYRLVSSGGGLPITTEDQVIGRLPGATGAPYPYAEYLPPGYLTSPTETYPLVLQLHDSGEVAATSTEAELVEVVSRYGPLELIRGSSAWKTYFGTKKVMVFAPRAAANWDPAKLDALVDFFITHYRVDPSRIYVTGRVQGGSGAWNYGYQHGDRIAALAPVGANLGAPGPTLTKLANVPVWMVDAWVTAGATTGQHSWLRGLTQAYGWNQYLTFAAPASTLTYVFNAANDTWSTQAGASAAGTSPIRFTVYPQGTTDFGTLTYGDQSFWDWMFAQQRP